MPIAIMPECCPVREHTADKKAVGRCWFHLKDGGICPRHRDVRVAVQRYKETGMLTNDYDLKKDR
jgi:hypothetical protein